jgi:hypothetical protein
MRSHAATICESATIDAFGRNGVRMRIVHGEESLASETGTAGGELPAGAQAITVIGMGRNQAAGGRGGRAGPPGAGAPRRARAPVHRGLPRAVPA